MALFRTLLKLQGQNDPTNITLHHGDCIIADNVAHRIAKALSWRVEIHPPDNPTKRAFCKHADLIHPEKPYLERNRDIVDASEALIATPAENAELARSGTWSTVRYARKKAIPVYIVFPDGSVRCQTN